MIHLNFLVDHMGNSQLSYMLTRTLNNLADTRQDIDAIVYFNTLSRTVMTRKFAIMQMIEAWGQPGYTIATTPSTVRKMLGFPGPQRLLWYVWDLFWIRGQQRVYDMHAPLFQDPRITLIARSETHANAIKNCFNVDKVYVMEDFDQQQLLKVIESEKIDTSNCAA